MFGFFKNLFGLDKKAKIKSQIDRKYKEALNFQRNGKLREYGQVMKEIEDLENAYIALDAGKVTDEN